MDRWLGMNSCELVVLARRKGLMPPSVRDLPFMVMPFIARVTAASKAGGNSVYMTFTLFSNCGRVVARADVREVAVVWVLANTHERGSRCAMPV